MIPVMKGDIVMKYVIRVFQVSTLLGGAGFMVMLLFGDLIESVKPVVLGAILASLIISVHLIYFDERFSATPI